MFTSQQGCIFHCLVMNLTKSLNQMQITGVRLPVRTEVPFFHSPPDHRGPHLTYLVQSQHASPQPDGGSH